MTHTTHTTAWTRNHRRSLAIVALAAVAITACSGGAEDRDTTTVDAPAEPATVSEDWSGAQADADGAVEAPSAEASDARAEPGGDVPVTDFGSIGRDVIVEMDVRLSSDDIGASVTKITTRAAALGGGVESSDIDYAADEDDKGRAWLVVKVPTDKVDELIKGLGEAGTVESISQQAQDVTDQLVDLDVRITNARRSVESVRSFMDRAEDLTDLVALERELSYRQTELERLEAEKKYLADRVALATVTIRVVPTDTAAEPEPTESQSIGDGLREGWDTLVALVTGALFAVAVALPFIAIGLVALALLWWAVRRRTRRTPAPAERLPEPLVSDDEIATPTG